MILNRNMKYTPNELNQKPNGIWYDFNGEEWKHLVDDRLGAIPEELYLVNVLPENEKDILVIETVEDAQEVINAFLSKKESPLLGRLDVASIMKEFGGMELRCAKEVSVHLDAQPDFSLFAAFGMWEIDSGCIWELDLINEFIHAQ